MTSLKKSHADFYCYGGVAKLYSSFGFRLQAV